MNRRESAIVLVFLLRGIKGIEKTGIAASSGENILAGGK